MSALTQWAWKRAAWGMLVLAMAAALTFVGRYDLPRRRRPLGSPVKTTSGQCLSISARADDLLSRKLSSS